MISMYYERKKFPDFLVYLTKCSYLFSEMEKILVKSLEVEYNVIQTLFDEHYIRRNTREERNDHRSGLWRTV